MSETLEQTALTESLSVNYWLALDYIDLDLIIVKDEISVRILVQTITNLRNQLGSTVLTFGA